jgi:hypothetical protein
MKQASIEKELEICSQHKRQGFCYWGVCDLCGVPQMLRKLQTGEVEHDEGKHTKFRRIVEEKMAGTKEFEFHVADATESEGLRHVASKARRQGNWSIVAW